MKRLVKNLFAGFVCSMLLVGCGGQQIESEPVIVHDPIVHEEPKTIIENVPLIHEEESQQGIGEVFEIESYNYKDRYSAYYSETLYGEPVLNVHLGDDTLETADFNDYYMIVAYHAVNVEYIVYTFDNGTNCVMHKDTYEYFPNQDINYYRN